MKGKPLLILLIATLSLTFSIPDVPGSSVSKPDQERPVVAFSFDDGSPEDILNYKGDYWNKLIVENLAKYDLQAVWFVAANKLNNEKGKALLQQWSDAGHLIANHTYNHFNYNNPSLTCEDYILEIRRCDSLINGFRTYRKIFRFPYLKAGNTVEKRDCLRKFFADNGYRQGWVTIDASDWYVNQRMVNRLKEDPGADISGYKEYYLNHIFDRAQYYNNLSKQINHSEIKHTLVLHFNLTSALFLPDLIEKFKKEGWEIQNYSDVLKDPVYNELPTAMPSEQSLIWLQAKQTGKFESQLRYPGEDAPYEKEKMDAAGL